MANPTVETTRPGFRARLCALMPQPRARDFSDLFKRQGYVEVAVARRILTR
jgi:hypothetical protein